LDLLGHTIILRREVCAHKTGLTPPLFIEILEETHCGEGHICVLWESILPLLYGGGPDRDRMVARSLVFCVVFCTSFALFLLTIVLLRFTAYNYLFGVFKLFLQYVFLISIAACKGTII